MDVFAKFLVAREQIQYAIDIIVGGYENAVSDGDIREEDMPNFEDMSAEIVSSVKHCNYGPGWEQLGAIPLVMEIPDAALKVIADYMLVESGYPMGD